MHSLVNLTRQDAVPEAPKEQMLSTILDLSTFFVIFWKKCEFQNPMDSGDFLARQDAAQEAPKVQIPIRFLKF